MDDLKAILDAAAKEVTVDCWADIQPPREAFCRTSLSSGPSTHRLERMAPDLAAEVVRLRKALWAIVNVGGTRGSLAHMQEVDRIARAALEGRA